jgi:predicted DCC family thiol-disulfide oxidoreductase YuxK
MHSLVLVEGDRVFFSPSAVLRILKSLGPPYSLTYIFVLVPRQIRDLVYAFVADRRLAGSASATFVVYQHPRNADAFSECRQDTHVT